MNYAFKVYEKVELTGRPMESAVDKVPLGSVGVVVRRDIDSRFNCQEYLVRFGEKEYWIKYNTDNLKVLGKHEENQP